MPIRSADIITVDTVAEKDATPTDTSCELLICKEDGYLYRKIANNVGGTLWGRKSTMSTSVYDLNNNGVVDDAEKLGGFVPAHYAGVADLANYAPLVAGAIPPQYLPPIPIGDALGVFASQAAMLAVTTCLKGDAAKPGDFGVRSDNPVSVCILGGLPASQIGNWMLLDISGVAGVASVNGHMGIVVIDKAAVGLGSVQNLAPASYPVSTPQAAAIGVAQTAAQAYTDTAIQGLTTGAVPEGSNQYFTIERTQDAVGTFLQDSTTLDGTYDDAGNVFSIDVKDASLTLAKLVPALQTILNKCPVPLFDAITGTQNTGTTETDLNTYTMTANRFAVNSEKIIAHYAGTFAGLILGGTQRIRAYAYGTLIFDSGALAVATASEWTLMIWVMRLSASSLEFMVELVTDGIAAVVKNAYTMTSVTLANAGVLKVTAQSAGLGAVTGNTVCKMATGEWKAAAAII